jgi:hypothetical protein
MQVGVGAKNRVVLYICLGLSFVLFLSACKPSGQSDLFGTYIADYEVAKEKLTLNKDGTFIQEVTLKATSKVDITKGEWSYDSASGYVTFEKNFLIVLNGFGELNHDYTKPSTGAVIEPVEKCFWHISIGTDEGILYKKVD